VHAEGWQAGYRGIVPEELLATRTFGLRLEQWRALLEAREEPRRRTLVAELGGEIVGVATVEPARDSDVDGRTTGEVRVFYVDAAHWRTGIGRTLMRGTMRTLREERFECAVLWTFEANEGARRFYEALGWELDRSESEWEGVPTVRYRTAL
jgi:GNAT superfamily N-acetyltransferase